MASRFPKSGDEDVEIHLTTDHQDDTFLLHSYVLALHSKWFKASLSERWNGSKTRCDGGDRWVYELRFDKNSAFGLLARRAKSNEPESTTTIFIQRKLPNDASTPRKIHKQRLARVDAHKSMFEAMYHISPTFSRSFAEAKVSLLQLAEVTEAYDCQQVVEIHINNHLNSSRTYVIRCCGSDPLDMLELARAIKSDWLFTEASIAIIGLWKDPFKKCEPRLRAMGCWDLIREKRAQFCQQLVSYEMQMFQIQPAYVATIQDTKAARQLAIDYFRHWLAEQLRTHGTGSSLHENYEDLYDDIKRRQYSIGITESEHLDVSAFIAKCRSSIDCSSVENELREIFAKAAEIVAPLQESKSSLEHTDLTFVSIRENEIPWSQKK